MRETIPLIGSIIDRGIDPNSAAQPVKDQLFENCLFYKVKNPFSGKETIYIERRPGVPATNSQISVSGYLALTGLYFWKALGTICKFGYTGGLTWTITITDTGGDNVLSALSNNPIVNIIEVKNSSGVNSLLVLTGSATTSLLTSCGLFADGDTSFTSVTLPSNAIGNMVYMNGYSFVGTTDGRIYNSPLNDPAGSYNDFIGSDGDSDQLRTIAKLDSLLFSFGETSLEAYRIGEQTTGSPLQLIPELFSKIGIYFPLGTLTKPPIIEGNNTLYWIGVNGSSVGVYSMENNRPKKLSGPFEDKYLASLDGSAKINYLEIGLKKLVLVQTQDVWLVYDIIDEIWNIWSSVYSTNLFSFWYNNFKTKGLIILDALNPGYWTWAPGDTVPYLDTDELITRKIRTSIIDFDTNDYKDFPSFAVIGDKQTTTSNISVRWTKDDYQTWNTAKTIDMSSANPKINALGVARRIAFELSDTVENPQRLRAIELEYNTRT